MQNTQPQTLLGQLWNSIQSWLFPFRLTITGENGGRF